jgi:hypothetical protein
VQIKKISNNFVLTFFFFPACYKRTRTYHFSVNKTTSYMLTSTMHGLSLSLSS